MASGKVQRDKLEIVLNAWERVIFDRPAVSLELNRIKKVNLEIMPDKDQLGVRISRKPIFGGLTGEWRSGSSRVFVFGGRKGTQALLLVISHPTTDKLWYAGANAKQLFDELTEKLAK